LSSCVQGDLYELYEDKSLFLSTIPRTKQQLVDPKPWYEPDEANIGENQCAVYALMKRIQLLYYKHPQGWETPFWFSYKILQKSNPHFLSKLLCFL
jgi:hypothetical protein